MRLWRRSHLCRSAEIEVTPGTRKSQAGTGADFLEPRQDKAAEAGVNVQRTLRRSASAPSSWIGSIVPCGYCGAEPTISIIFRLISFATWRVST